MSRVGGWLRSTLDPDPRPGAMDNDRTMWIFVALMVVTFIFFAAGVIGLAFWDFN